MPKALKPFSRTTLLILLAVVFLSGCFKNLPDKTVVLQCDFENGKPGNASVLFNNSLIDSPNIIPFNNSHIFGRFNNEIVRFTFDNMPNHNAVRIEFDLLIHDKWDGDYIRSGSTIPDIWKMTIDGYQVYLTTFSNSSYNQSFPQNYTGSTSKYPSRSDSWEQLPGVCANSGISNGSSLYKIDYTTSHSGKLLLELSDALQPFNNPCLKSWSIDNVKITAIQYN